jgi:hypothetical protein
MRRNHACLPGYLMLLMLLFRYFKHLFFAVGGWVGTMGAAARSGSEASLESK